MPAIGIDRDDAVGQGVHVANVLVGGVVGRLALLAVPRLVNTEDERPLPQRLAGEFQASGPQRFHGPVRLSKEVVEGLWVGFGGLRQARQRFALGLGDQAQLEAGELLELADIGEH